MNTLTKRNFPIFRAGAKSVSARDLNALSGALRELYGNAARLPAWMPDYEAEAPAAEAHPFRVTARLVKSAETGKKTLSVTMDEGRVYVDRRENPMIVTSPYVMSGEWEIANPEESSYDVYFTFVYYNNNAQLLDKFDYEVTAEDPAEAMMQGYVRYVLQTLYSCFPFTLTPRLPYGSAVLSGTPDAEAEKSKVEEFTADSVHYDHKTRVVIATVRVDAKSGDVRVEQKLRNNLFLTHFHSNT